MEMMTMMMMVVMTMMMMLMQLGTMNIWLLMIDDASMDTKFDDFAKHYRVRKVKSSGLCISLKPSWNLMCSSNSVAGAISITLFYKQPLFEIRKILNKTIFALPW